MNRRPKADKSSLLFLSICIIAFLFVFSPLLMRIPFIYNLVCKYLVVFPKSEYKSAYVEAVGAIGGSFLAITGAIWTQNILNRHEKKIQIEKDALIVYYDFKFALDSIREIMEAIYPLTKGNVLPEDEATIDKFRKKRRKYNIFINSDWRQLIINLRDELAGDEIHEAQVVYGRLEIISKIFNRSVSEISRNEDKKLYALMHDMIHMEFALKEPIIYEISINPKIVALIDKVAKIAHLGTT